MSSCTCVKVKQRLRTFVFSFQAFNLSVHAVHEFTVLLLHYPKVPFGLSALVSCHTGGVFHPWPCLRILHVARLQCSYQCARYMLALCCKG